MTPPNGGDSPSFDSEKFLDRLWDESWERLQSPVVEPAISLKEKIEVVLPKYSKEWNPNFTDEEKSIIEEQMEAEKREKEEFERLTQHEINLTDMGNGQIFAIQHHHHARYCFNYKTWFIYDGKRWKPDDSGEVVRLGKQTVRQMMKKALKAPDDESLKQLMKHALTTQSASSIENMVRLAQSELPVRPDDLDKNRNLFNVLNGTFIFDRKNKRVRFRDHNKYDFVSRVANVARDPDAKCPRWLDHVKMVMLQDTEMIEAFQKVCGYTILGDNPDDKFFMLIGTGANGKDVTVTILSELMADYCKNAAPNTFQVNRNQESGIRSDIVRLEGARMVTVNESERGAVLAEAFVKAFTGGGKITAREPYGKEREYTPQAKVLYISNYKPKIKGLDEGIWRRILLFPFEYTIAEERRRPREDVLTELRAEMPGILNWIVEGLEKYLQDGKLKVPEKVIEANKEYRALEDPLKGFLKLFLIEPNEETTRKEFQQIWRDYCTQIDDEPMSYNEMIGELKRRRIVENGRVYGGVRYWQGLRPKELSEIDDEE